jgi:hypothetical protein
MAPIWALVTFTRDGECLVDSRSLRASAPFAVRGNLEPSFGADDAYGDDLGDDLGDDGFGRSGRAAGTIPRAAQVIDHHFCAAFGQGEGVFAPQSAAGSGYNRHPTVKPHCHSTAPFVAKAS